jgi:hypothetical protein
MKIHAVILELLQMDRCGEAVKHTFATYSCECTEISESWFRTYTPVCVQVELLETVTSALVCLLQAQPSLADQVPSLGHIPQLCKKMVMHRQQGAIIRATVLVLHQLATSEVRILQASVPRLYLFIYLFINLCIHVGACIEDMGEKCMLFFFLENLTT